MTSPLTLNKLQKVLWLDVKTIKQIYTRKFGTVVEIQLIPPVSLTKIATTMKTAATATATTTTTTTTKTITKTLAQFHQLGARRKLLKARPFLFIFQNVVIYKMTKLF